VRDPLTDFEYDAYGAIASAKDWRGNRVYVGDKVMYCIGAGRGQMMAIGTLLEIRIDERPYTDYGGQRHVERIIKTKVLTEATSGLWNNASRSKPAQVNPMNITALSTLSPGIEQEAVDSIMKELA
jgi:hypothetical protein